ncbi:hypothetical protein CHUAL_008450 [Chamberlinius hualienensis]
MLKGLPGPRILPLIGTAWTYLPFVGQGDVPERMHESYLRKYNLYGEVVQEVLRGARVVSLYNPLHIQKILLSEATEAERISHQVLKKFREDRPDLYLNIGLVPSNGQEWYNIRKAAEKPMRTASSSARISTMFNETADEYIKHLVETGNQSPNGTVEDVVPLNHHWALENIATLVLDKRLDKFSFKRKAICDELVDAGLQYLYALAKGEVTTLWKYFNTATYRNMEKYDLYFYYFIKEHVDAIIASGVLDKPEAEDSPLLVKYLRTNMDIRNVITVAADLLIAGHLTTAFAASYILYALGKNEDKQEMLYRELREVFPSSKNMHVSPDQAGPSLQRGIKYLDYCYSEALRMYPVTIGNGRVVTKDTPVGDYVLKPGTIVITQNQIASRRPEYLSNPDVFYPERWEKDSSESKGRNSERYLLKWLAIPFGIGHRMCMGKLISEHQTKVFLAKLFRQYRVVTKGPAHLQIKTLLVNVPDDKIELQFIPRED